MQTFMPYDDFSWSARVLDDKRLGKQRVETMQIMQTIYLGAGGLARLNHPGVQMWVGYERALLAYQQAVCYEWTSVRGFNDTCWDKTRLVFLDANPDPMSIPLIPPPWMGNDEFHIMYQSKLMRKDKEHYSKWFPGMPDDIPFVWPNGKVGED